MRMRFERYFLGRPYPAFYMGRDGRDYVLSIGRFYFRLVRS